MVEDALVFRFENVLSLVSHLFHKLILNLLLPNLVGELKHLLLLFFLLFSGRSDRVHQLAFVMLELVWVPLNVLFIVFDHH